MPTYNSDIKYLEQAINSCVQQEYGCWELCICDDGSTDKSVTDKIREWCAKDARIRAVFAEKNEGVGAASNHALKICDGEYVGFLDDDDILDKSCLMEVVRVLMQNPDAKVVYSDETIIDTVTNRMIRVIRKPDFSPDRLLNTNYINHFTVVEKKVLDECGGFDPTLSGAQDHDILLKISEKTDKFYHIPKFLYFLRQDSNYVAGKNMAKSRAFEAGLRAVRNALERRGLQGTVKLDKKSFLYRVKYILAKQPKVSIIIPFKDKPSLLKRCLESIFKRTSYRNIEIVLVDNKSTSPTLLRYLKSQMSDSRMRVIQYNKPFNYATINNDAARVAGGEYLLFLNNDTEVISPHWIEEMLGICQQRHVGVVGAKLLFPTKKVQHAGVSMVKVRDILQFYNISDDPDNGDEIVKNCIAVTGACMMVKRETFEKVGGFDEKLGVFFNDTDFCLSAREKGYFVAYTPYAKLIHYEGSSRGAAEDRLMKENSGYISLKWGDKLSEDTYHNPPKQLFWGDWAAYLKGKPVRKPSSHVT